MRIVCTSGANLRPAELVAYDVVVTASRVMVDGVEYDTRTPYPLADVDRWVETAREMPHVLGTTASEVVEDLLKVGQQDTELLFLVPARKLAGTYQAALSAERILKARSASARTRLSIVELNSTDGAAALAVIYAGEARNAGLSYDRVVEATRAFIAGTQTVIVPQVLDHLIKGGRATFLRGMVADLAGRSPVVVFDGGEMRPNGDTLRSEARGAILVELERRLRGKRLWLVIGHGGNEKEAQQLAREIQSRFQVEHALVRPLSPTSYIHLGPRALAAFAAPLDDLPWVPPTPR